MLFLGFALLPASASALAVGAQFGGKLPSYDPSLAEQTRELDRMRDQGSTVVRHHISWTRLAAQCSGQTAVALSDHLNLCYNWSVLDSAVRLSNERGMRVMLTLSGVPSWLHGSEDPYYVGGSASEFNRFADHYAAVLKAASTRYAAGSGFGRVRLWTVWQEPNSQTYFRGVDRAQMARRYAHLYAKSAIALKSVDSANLVAAGPTGPTGGGHGLRPLVFVSQVQHHLPGSLPGTSDERRFIDAWAHNAFTGESPFTRQQDPSVVTMPNLPALLAQLDTRSLTRGLPVWATEYGWETKPPNRYFGVRPLTQGRYMAEALDFLHGLGRVPVAIQLGVTDPTDLSDWQSGTYFADGRAKPSIAWARRPISVRYSQVPRGTSIRVWARSNLRPSRTRIAYSVEGGPWRLVPNINRRKGGVVIAFVRVNRNFRFATYDGVLGPARSVYVTR